jgi:hypothetical protein
MFKYDINGDYEHFDNTSTVQVVPLVEPQGSLYSTLAEMSTTLGNMSSTLGNMSSTLGRYLSSQDNMNKLQQPNQSSSVLGNTEKDKLIKSLLVLMYKMKNQIQVVPDETKAINEMWQSKSITEKDSINKMTMNELNNTIKYFQEIVSRQQNISTQPDNTVYPKMPPAELKNYKYSGCFSGEPEKSSFVKIPGTYDVNSCINSVVNSGEQYNYVSIQNGNQCWAGNNADKKYFILKDNFDPECDMNAPGAWINYMYKNTTPVIQPNRMLESPTQPTQPPTQPIVSTMMITANVEKDKLIGRYLVLNFLKSIKLLTTAMFDESLIINMIWGKMSQTDKNKLSNMTIDELKYHVNQLSVEQQLQPTQNADVDPNKEPDGPSENAVVLIFNDNSTINLTNNMTINNTRIKDYLLKRGNIKSIEIGKNMLVSVQLLAKVGKKIAINLNNIKTKFDTELSTVYQILIRPLTDDDRKVELYREKNSLMTILKDGDKLKSNKGNNDYDEVKSVKIGLAYAVFLKNEIMPQSILSGNHPEPELGYYSRVFGMEIKPSKISFSEYN